MRKKLNERITAGQADEEDQHSAHEAPGEMQVGHHSLCKTKAMPGLLVQHKYNRERQAILMATGEGLDHSLAYL